MRWALAVLLVGLPVVPGCFLDSSGLVVGGDAGAPDAAFDAGMRDTGVDAACVPRPEICDGADNDCDLSTADGMVELGTPCDGDDSDLCDDDTAVACNDGVLACGTSADNIEVCNGDDDDCDGQIEEDANCPCNLVRFGEHAYLFCDGTPRTWTDALGVCPSGYNLVQITSPEEQGFVFRTAMAASDADFWIGARDPESDGSFRWEVDGSDVPPPGGDFQNWGAGLPDGNGDCLEIDVDGSSGDLGTWNDAPCDDPNRSICESL